MPSRWWRISSSVLVAIACSMLAARYAGRDQRVADAWINRRCQA
jgi:hypothetical protein